MSVEEAVTDGLQAPVDNNAKAAEDAKNMLAELQGDGEKGPDPTTTVQSAERPSKGEDNSSADAEADTRHPDRRRENEDDDRDDKRSGRRDKDRRNDRSDRRGGRNDRGRDRGGRGRGRGGSRTQARDNIKSVVTQEEESDDPVAIRKQVEFYFSDSNLLVDKFLLSRVEGSKNLPVDLDVICSFKRMRHFQPRSAIVAALKDSTVVDLTDNDTKIQRKEPLPEGMSGDNINMDAVKVYEDKSMPRSVYVKGFGEEQPSTQFDIEAWFAEFGTTNAIRLRRSDDKTFKRSVFAEFDSEETAKKFLALDPKPQYKGNDLQIMSKKEYCDKKVEDIKSGKIRPNSHLDGRGRGGHRGRDGGRFDKRGDRDDRDWRERREEDRKNGFKDKRREDRHKSEREREDAKREAIAQAKAAVEAEDEKEKTNGQASPVGTTATDANVDASKKREREDDNITDVPAAKKVDTK